MSDLIRKNTPANPGEHVIPWLGAYLDGEVTSAHRVEIEEHLSGCFTCRAELESLQQLGDLLHGEPPLASHTRESVFVRQVVERINRPTPRLWQQFFQFTWRLAPLFIFGVWAFCQAVSWVSGLVLAGMGWIPGMQDAFEALAPLTDIGGSSPWNDLLQLSLLNPGVHRAAESFAWLEPSAVMLLLNLALLGILGVLFASWLASWWAYHRSKA
jgi:hypothetical protein